MFCRFFILYHKNKKIARKDLPFFHFFVMMKEDKANKTLLFTLKGDAQHGFTSKNPNGRRLSIITICL